MKKLPKQPKLTTLKFVSEAGVTLREAQEDYAKQIRRAHKDGYSLLGDRRGGRRVA